MVEVVRRVQPSQGWTNLHDVEKILRHPRASDRTRLAVSHPWQREVRNGGRNSGEHCVLVTIIAEVRTGVSAPRVAQRCRMRADDVQAVSVRKLKWRQQDVREEAEYCSVNADPEREHQHGRYIKSRRAPHSPHRISKIG